MQQLLNLEVSGWTNLLYINVDLWVDPCGKTRFFGIEQTSKMCDIINWKKQLRFVPISLAHPSRHIQVDKVFFQCIPCRPFAHDLFIVVHL